MAEEEKKDLEEVLLEEEGAVEVAAEEMPEADKEKLSFKDKKKMNAELKKLRDQVEEANKASEEMKDRYTRMCAEFENYKRRTGKELDARYADAKGDVWKNILPVVDNFERALAQETDESNASYKQGVEMIYRQLVEAMKAAGVEEIEALNAEFNPEFHNAVMHVDDESVGANIIVDVFAKGYKMGDKVLRYSMVKVAN
ncbi:MAG: nucleotide exchange factor GrpE [Clostridia bacterium]|nr:nucleotide exchange factor GrpE [Clostridia bacterium]